MGNKEISKYPFRFFIGTQKAGSSYFYNLLLSHPDVCLHELTEVNYFLHNFDNGIDWYLDGFRGQGKRVDISPKYFMLGETAAPRIREYADKYLEEGKPLFVLVLRNPIDYLYSHFRMQILQDKSGKLAKERGDFVAFLKQNPGYLQRAKYAKILKKEWFKYFPQNQFKIVIFEEFVKDKDRLILDILKFWDLPPAKLSASPASRNKMLRFKFLIKWRNMAGKNQKLKSILKQSKLFNILYNNILTTKSSKKLSLGERQEVKAMLSDEVKDLAELLGRDLSVWRDF